MVMILNGWEIYSNCARFFDIFELLTNDHILICVRHSYFNWLLLSFAAENLRTKALYFYRVDGRKWTKCHCRHWQFFRSIHLGYMHSTMWYIDVKWQTNVMTSKRLTNVRNETYAFLRFCVLVLFESEFYSCKGIILVFASFSHI